MITVVVPVFNAVRELAGCLDSLARHTARATTVYVIDDASTDPSVGTLLRAWKDRAPPAWRFLENTRNLGFVVTANRGMALSDHDIVLLNSDTVVTPGWLSGLADCLASDPLIATATPWSNNAEIASFPVFCEANPIPESLDELGSLLAGLGDPAYPDIPTAVGFCMAIKRQVIEKIGYFDEEQFGRGYGEENDFSLRASLAGYRNVLCDAVYVAHHGGSSFGPTGMKPGEDSMARLLHKHPAYLQQVSAFIEADPLARHRERLSRACAQAGIRLG